MKINKLQRQLRKLIRSELIKKLESEDGVEFLRIIEPQNQEILKNSGANKLGLLAEIKIENDIPHEFAAFVLDPNNIEKGHELTKFKNFSWLIVENRKFTDRDCDIVIVLERYNRYEIIIGELKSSSYIRKNLYNKFINSYYIIDYLVKLVREYDCKLIDIPKYYFVVFSTSRKIQKIANKNPGYVRKVKKGELEGNPLDKLPGKLVPFEVKNNELISFKKLLRESKKQFYT